MTYKSGVIIQERIPEFVYQLHIQSANPKGLALARAVLLNLGFRGGDFVSSEFNGRQTLELFDENRLGLEKAEKLFRRVQLAGIKVGLRRLEPKDWLTLWKSRWKPAALTKKLDVVPVWYLDKYKPKKGRDYILMDTLLSFGTGLHETTRIMAQFIEDKTGAFRSFFDIGTGTGILAFVALKCAAHRVSAIDIGPLSVQAAMDNMKANDLYFDVRRSDLRKTAVRETFDFVAANLVTDDLMANAPKIIRFIKRGGFLAVSGISLENLRKLRQKFSEFPLKCLKISKGEKWSGLLYQKM
jgi:ribosomal protein L11 methyltransferase